MAGKIFSALAVLIGSASAFVIPHLDLQVNVNTPVLSDLINQWRQYGNQSVVELHEAHHTYKLAKESIFANTTDFIIEQFEHLVKPVAMEFAETIQEAQEDLETCNKTCITTQCLSHKSWTMNWSCVQDTCYCDYPTFDFSVKNFLKGVNKTNAIVSKKVQQSISDMKEAYSQYRQVQQDVMLEAYNVTQNQLLNELQCDPVCINRCHRFMKMDMFSYSSCISNCDCEVELISVQNVTSPYHNSTHVNHTHY
jgi:hypothetical protein